MAEKRIPHRRFTAEIRVSADSLEDLQRALLELSHAPKDSTMGGPTMGYTCKLSEDPEMTHEKYFAEVEAYLGAREVAKGRDPNGGGWDGDCG